MDIVLQIFLFLIVLASVLFMSYIVTRYVGRKMGKSMKGRHIAVVESLNLGTDKSIHLIKAGDKLFLISSSGKNISLISEINMDSIQDIQPVDQPVFDFKMLFEKYLTGFRNKHDAKEIISEEKPSIPRSEPIDVVSFRDNLERLRRITSRTDKNNKKAGENDET
jgi:flagellar protein FliO/FliZ